LIKPSSPRRSNVLTSILKLRKRSLETKDKAGQAIVRYERKARAKHEGSNERNRTNKHNESKEIKNYPQRLTNNVAQKRKERRLDPKREEGVEKIRKDKRQGDREEPRQEDSTRSKRMTKKESQQRTGGKVKDKGNKARNRE
jgi:hypothetical protein